MRRREFLTLLGGAAAAWPLAARAALASEASGQRGDSKVRALASEASAQQAGKRPTIGFLGAATPSATNPWTAPLIQRLRELGWIEGRTIAIEFRWAEGRAERFAEIAAEFVGLKVDVIVTHSTGPVIAAKQATSVIPIVFANSGDPVAAGLVASLARPGGNVTGLSIQGPDTVGKRLDLLREVAPGIRRLAIIANSGNPAAVLEMGEVQAAARTLGLEVIPLEVRRPADIAPAFEAVNGPAAALYVVPDPLIFTNRIRINTLAVAARVPTLHGLRDFVEAGGLMSYGANFPDLWRRAAEFVDKILRGAKPADIPVEQPTKFDLVVNLTTARALGVDVPATLLARADEVIE